MIITADASFLVSLYGGDVNTPVARAWRVAQAEPILPTDALRFETENALRLACFRGRMTPVELNQALADIENDLAQGILIATHVDSDPLWTDARRISATHTLNLGSRAYDITHLAAASLLEADVFLSFDGRQKALATLMGIAVAP